MRTILFLFGAFGLEANAFLHLQGAWMPVLLFTSIACLIVAIFLRGDDSPDSY